MMMMMMQPGGFSPKMQKKKGVPERLPTNNKRGGSGIYSVHEETGRRGATEGEPIIKNCFAQEQRPRRNTHDGMCTAGGISLGMEKLAQRNCVNG